MKKSIFKTIETSPKNIYKVQGFQLFNNHNYWLDELGIYRDYYQFGRITLLNTVTNVKSDFAIWGEDVEDGMYVCLPTGDIEEDGEEELEDYLIDYFGFTVTDDGEGFQLV
ncbi:MAG: hypothetical protein N2A99_04060 [Carnobacterium alterfunditum]